MKSKKRSGYRNHQPARIHNRATIDYLPAPAPIFAKLSVDLSNEQVATFRALLNDLNKAEYSGPIRIYPVE